MHSYRPNAEDSALLDPLTLVLSVDGKTWTMPASGSTLLSSVAIIAAITAAFTGATLSGTTTVAGPLVDTSIQDLTTAAGVGVVNVTTGTTRLTSTGADALSLANGTHGQLKTITMVVDGGDATLTPTTKTGFTTIVFGDVGDSVTLRFYTTLGWMLQSNVGATAT